MVIQALRVQAGLPKSPDGETGIRRFLSGTALPSLRDPWGNSYRTRIEPVGAGYAIKFQSAGPDKVFDTDDDFDAASFSWPYFAEYEAKIQNAVEEYHARTGAYLRDVATLKSELLSKGISLDSLRDPWGGAYRVDFGVERNFYLVEVRSAGPDAQFAAADAPSSDDVVVSRNLIDYFRDTREKMDAALLRLEGQVSADTMMPHASASVGTGYDAGGFSSAPEAPH